MSATDEFDIDADLPVEPAKAAQYLLYTIAGFLLFALVWAATAELDRVTRGQGRVVPSSRLQEVQYLEGGIVKEILVRAGQQVKARDILIRLDPKQRHAEYLQGRDGRNLLTARILRLEAGVKGTPLTFPDALDRAAPEITADERQQYAAWIDEFEAALRVEEAKLEDAEAAHSYAREAMALASEENAMIAPLVAKGIEPQIELLRARQRRATALGETQRAEIAVRSATSAVARVRNSFTATAADELARAKAEMASISGELPALEDAVERTAVRSPIDGVVNRVLVATIGGVVQPGQTIVEIVPNGETPLIEAQIKPSDIGFLRIGQEAKVKISAYDASIYGSLDAYIETISPDAIQDEDTGERFFVIKVRTKETALQTSDGPLRIFSGMAAEVDVLNGKRTVLAYILTPLTKVQNKALRDK